MIQPPLGIPRLTLHSDRALVRARASSRRHLLVTVQAPESAARRERPPVSVALVLDRSGSMAGARKFALAREAVAQALGLLRPDDRFTLVVYDTEIDVLVPATRATPDARRRALDLLRDVEPRGGTDLCEGWLRGCAQLADVLDADGVSRVLLLTDGLANHGEMDRDVLARHAGELRQRGIATSTFGVGADFDERLLRDMAHEGGGHFYFVEHAAQIPDLLTSELGEALEVVMRNATLEVLLPRRADAMPLNRFRHARTREAHGDGETLRIELGDLVSGQEVRAVLRVQLPHGDPGTRVGIRIVLGGDTRTVAPVEATLAWTYAGHAENDRQPRDTSVDREVAAIYATRARAEATEANRHGDYLGARRAMERTAERIATYAGEDAELHELVNTLRDEVPQFALRAMSPMALKGVMFESENVGKGRGRDGRARRR